MNKKGMSTAEMMMATFMMTMVLLCVASLNASFTYQAASIKSGEEFLNRKALVALHGMGQHATVATRIDSPLPGTAADFLAGGINVDASATDNSNPLNGNHADTKWFVYCVSGPTPQGICGGRLNPAPCLFSYEGSGWPPPVGAASFQGSACGTVIGGVTPTLWTGAVACPNGSNGTPSSCFTRIPAERVPETNQVRVYFSLNSAALGEVRAANSSVEATFNAQFAN